MPAPAPFAPIRPCEILVEDFVKPMGLTEAELAAALRLSERHVHSVLTGFMPLDAGLALRLARYFGTTPTFWLTLQSTYDLNVATDRIGQRVHSEVTPRAA